MKAGNSDKRTNDPRVPILFINPFSGNTVGGAERQTLETIRALPEDRYRPYLITFSENPFLKQELKHLSIVHRTVPIRRLYGVSGLRGLLRIRSFVREWGVRVIHSYLITGNSVAALIGRWCGIPSVISIRNMYQDASRKQIFLMKWNSRIADRVLFNSERVREYQIRRLGISFEKTGVLYNGIFPGRLEKILRDPGLRDRLFSDRCDFLVINVASLTRKKDHETLLRAFLLLRQGVPGARLLILGCGPRKQELVKMVEQCGLGAFVHFGGLQMNPIPYMAESDLMVLSSREEGMPNVVLEALGIGLPVLSTDVGGVREIDGESNSLGLVPPGDPDCMGKEMLRLYHAPDLRNEMARRGQDRFRERFDVSRLIEDLTALHRQMRILPGAGPC